MPIHVSIKAISMPPSLRIKKIFSIWLYLRFCGLISNQACIVSTADWADCYRKKGLFGVGLFNMIQMRPAQSRSFTIYCAKPLSRQGSVLIWLHMALVALLHPYLQANIRNSFNHLLCFLLIQPQPINGHLITTQWEANYPALDLDF
jgi:hypothetical protein